MFYSFERLSLAMSLFLQLALCGAQNLLENPKFEKSAGTGKMHGWSINKPDCVKAHDGIMDITVPNNVEFKMYSSNITLNQTKAKTIKFGLSMKGEAFSTDWRYGIVLDKLSYQDGTKESWKPTFTILNKKAVAWKRITKSWIPPKPVKSFRLLFICGAQAELAVKDIFVEEAENVVTTANVKENYTGEPSNLVSNNGFEIVSAGMPKNWTEFFGTHQMYSQLPQIIKFSTDSKYRRSGEYSLKISGTEHSLAGVENIIYSIIDFTRPFRLSGYVKAEKASGVTFLEAVFYRAWLPMGFGFLSERRNYGSYWNMVEKVGCMRTPITSGTHDWKLLTVAGKAPAGANLVRFRIHSINNRGTIWVDDLEFDGFGTTPVEIITSQVGFSLHGAKKAFVRTNIAGCKGTFTLKDGDNELLNGKLIYVGQGEFGRNIFCADFSRIEKSGNYRIQVDIGKQRSISPEFAISENLFRDLAEKSRSMMFFQRCGFEVPGVHKACHLDDGQIRSQANLAEGGKIIGHVDMSGGWHDAGDYDKYLATEMLPIIALGRLGRRFNCSKLLDEAAWGAKHQLKAILPDGRMYYNVVRKNRLGEIKMEQIAPEDETDNKVGTVDDRMASGPGYSIHSALALAEYALIEKNPGRSREALGKAILLRDAFVKSSGMVGKKAARLQHIPLLLMCDLALYRKTKGKKYRDSTGRFLKIILAAINETSAAEAWNRIKEDNHYYPYAFVIAPLRFALAFPDDPMVPKIKKAVTIYLNQEILPSVASSSFGILDARKRLRQGKRTGHSSLCNLGAAVVMALASRLFKDRAYLEKAESLLNFVFGINPAGICLIAGNGWKSMMIISAANGLPGRTNGTVVPGAVHKGVPRAKGKTKASPANLENGFFYRNIDHPRGYPISMVAYDYPMWGMTCAQEEWEAVNAVFMIALDDILEAKDKLK